MYVCSLYLCILQAAQRLGKETATTETETEADAETAAEAVTAAEAFKGT